MGIVFREIGSRVPWNEKLEEEDWLSDEDIRADALKSFKSDHNTLSVYVYEDVTHIKRIIGAFCAARDNVSKLDYALFDESLLNDIKVLQEATPAINVPDSEVANWHRDLVKLSGTKVLELAKIIKQKGEIKRAQDVEVGKAINKLITLKLIDETKLKASLIADLKKERYQN